jgi:hypothetical protein
MESLNEPVLVDNSLMLYHVPFTDSSSRLSPETRENAVSPEKQLQTAAAAPKFPAHPPMKKQSTAVFPLFILTRLISQTF